METIFCFKYPKHRGNLYELITAATGDNVLRREKIYRFTNVFSHSQGIDLLWKRYGYNDFLKVEYNTRDI